MNLYKKSEIKKLLKSISEDDLAEFIMGSLDQIQINRLKQFENSGISKSTNYDEFLIDMLPWYHSKIKELSLMTAEDNDYMPDETISCKLPKDLEPFKSEIYFIYMQNGQVEARYKLPEEANRVYYNNRTWNVINGFKIKYRQQSLLYYFEVDKKIYLVLRGYGSKEFNRYAVSVYNATDQTLWLIPDYEEILRLYKEIIENPKLKELEDGIEKIINGLHPFNLFSGVHDESLSLKEGKLEIDSGDELIPKEKVNIGKYKLFLYFLHYLMYAEDSGFFSREVTKLGFQEIKQGKSISQARTAQNKFQRDLYEKLADKEIDKILNTYRNMMEFVGDSDGVISTIMGHLYETEDSILNQIYKRMNFRLHKPYTEGLSYEDRIGNIIKLIPIMA